MKGKNIMDNNEPLFWQQFKLIGDKKQEQQLSELISKKNLTQEDLKLILKTIRLNPYCDD